MRVYLMLREKRTTISIEDQLVAYLADRVCCSGIARAALWKQETRKWMQKTVDAAGPGAPTKNVSQWMRARIIDAIVDPALVEARRQGAEARAEGMKFFAKTGA